MFMHVNCVPCAQVTTAAGEPESEADTSGLLLAAQDGTYHSPTKSTGKNSLDSLWPHTVGCDMRKISECDAQKITDHMTSQTDCKAAFGTYSKCLGVCAADAVLKPTIDSLKDSCSRLPTISPTDTPTDTPSPTDTPADTPSSPGDTALPTSAPSGKKKLQKQLVLSCASACVRI